MKKLLAFALALLFILAFAACGNDSNALTEDEQLLVDNLIKISQNYLVPSEVRLLEVADYRLYDASGYDNMGYTRYYGVKVKLQGQVKLYGAAEQKYLIRMKTETYSQEAIEAVNKHFDDNIEAWQKNWNECAPNEYPRKDFSTFEEYRENVISFLLVCYCFDDEASARAAAERDFKSRSDYEQSKWDKCPEDEYPRNQYDSFEAYREGEIESTMENYLYPYPKVMVPDRSGYYIELHPNESFLVDAESTFNVAKINKALKAYWDGRAGN